MPCTRGLLKTIESFDHTTQMLWLREIKKPGRLMHIHFLLKNIMEKSILNIKLMKMLAICDS
jgi:hypothetical protein